MADGHYQRFQRTKHCDTDEDWLASSLGVWMLANHAEIAPDYRGNDANWLGIGRVLAKAGHLDCYGLPPDATTAAETWRRVDAHIRS